MVWLSTYLSRRLGLGRSPRTYFTIYRSAEICLYMWRFDDGTRAPPILSGDDIVHEPWQVPRLCR